MHHLVPGVMRAQLEYEPGTAYAYTNAPHLLLGIAIEAITGRAYADYCAATVLQPLGVRDAALHPRWAVLGSFGGWNLSGAEYLAFLRAFAPGAPVLGEPLRAWAVAGGPYSLLFVRAAGADGHDVYHAGSWGYRSSARSPSGEINDSIGTRAMRAAFGASWYVVFEPRPPVSARDALDRELYRAASAIRVWPETDLSASPGLR
jgi:CubicO group peptidase (beta-lactamase class C family)